MGTLPFRFEPALPPDPAATPALYHVSFVAAPNDEERAVLEARISAALRAASTPLAAPLAWDGACARLHLAALAADHERIFCAVSDALAAIHEHCPVTALRGPGPTG